MTTPLLAAALALAVLGWPTPLGTPDAGEPLTVVRPGEPPELLAVHSLADWPYIDLGALCAAAGVEAAWEPAALTATLATAVGPLRVLDGAGWVLAGEHLAPLSRPVRLVDGRLLVPLDFAGLLAEALGEGARFERDERRLVVDYLPAEHLPPGAGSLSPVVIGLDPGHGGPDPGQLSEAGRSEAGETWELARELAHRLWARHGRAVALSRAEDVCPDLEGRALTLHRAGATAVLALHAGAPGAGPAVLRIVSPAAAPEPPSELDPIRPRGTLAAADRAAAGRLAAGLAAALRAAYPDLVIERLDLPLAAAAVCQLPVVLIELPAPGRPPADPAGRAYLAEILAGVLADWAPAPAEPEGQTAPGAAAPEVRP